MAIFGNISKLFLAMGVLAMVAGCGNKPSRMQRAMAEKDEHLRRKDGELADMRKQNDLLMEQSTATSEQNKALADNVGAMARLHKEQLVQTEQKVDSLKDQLARLEGKLGAQKDGDVQVMTSADKAGIITIRVANTVLFDLGQADLKPSAHSKLNQIAQTLKTDYAANFVRVEGHTDSSPVVRNRDKFADNMVLSQARSKAVYDYLIKNASMPANRMYTAGYSYYQPIAWPEKTPADRAKNRRVDIVILPNVKVSKERLTAKN